MFYFTLYFSFCISTLGRSWNIVAATAVKHFWLKLQTRAFSQLLIAKKVSCQPLVAIQDLGSAVNCKPYSWSPTYDGHSTGGHWSFGESKSHVNILEVKDALFALKIYCTDVYEISVHFKIDNTFTIVWINKQTAHNRKILN